MTARNRQVDRPARSLSICWGTTHVTFALLLLASGLEPAVADERRPEYSPNGYGQSTADESADSRSRGDEERDERREAFENSVRVLEKGSSSRSFRKAAMAALPVDKLSEDDRERAVAILRSADMFRELPVLECDVEPEVFQYFARHPDVAVSIWRAMKISTFQMSQTTPSSYDVDSGDGTTGKIDVLHQSDTECLVLCSGLFKNPLLPKPINATGLFHLETSMKTREDGTSVAEHRGRMFVAFPSQAVGTVAKVVSPVSNVIIDRNFREVSLFVHMMSVAMQRQPGWIEHVAKRLEGVPAERQVELLKVTAETYVAARRRALAAGRPFAGEHIDIDELLPPTVDPKAAGSNPPLPRVASQPMGLMD